MILNKHIFNISTKMTETKECSYINKPEKINTSIQSIEVERIDVNTNNVLEKYSSIEDAAKWIYTQNLALSVHSAQGCISCCVRNVTKTAFGFVWKKPEQKSIENEEWKNVIIDGKPVDEYQVSSLGRFKNKKNVIMSNYSPHHTGYIYVRVNKQKYALHRLIAQTFIPNVQTRTTVTHIDGNKENNSISNLKWK